MYVLYAYIMHAYMHTCMYVYTYVGRLNGNPVFAICQLNHGPALQKGDVILSNHPAAGGSHLPDLTVITPVSTLEKEYVVIHA